MLSHGNLLSIAYAAKTGGISVDDRDSIVSYLPLAHSMEQCIFTVCMMYGGRTGYYSGDPLKLLEDLQELKPTIFPSVPRLFNRIYDKIKGGVKDKSTVQ